MNGIRQKIEIVIHVDEDLADPRQQQIASVLEEAYGVAGARFSDRQRHLMVVDYDPDQISAQEILSRVSSQQVRAELIGPM